MCTYIYIYIYIYIYTHTHRHTHTHTQTRIGCTITNFRRGVPRRIFGIRHDTGSRTLINTLVSDGPGDGEGCRRQVPEFLELCLRNSYMLPNICSIAEVQLQRVACRPLRWCWVLLELLERTPIPSGIQFTTHFIDFLLWTRNDSSVVLET